MSKGKIVAALGSAALGMIAAVIQVEGGYVNHPNDPGGETNMGITKRVAVENGYTGHMRALPRNVAENIYYQSYLVKPGYEPLISLDAAVTEELFDTTVNMGPARPSRWLQQSLNELCPALKLKVDGQVGPATVAGYARCQRTLLCQAMLPRMDGLQRAEYDRLVRVNPKLKVFHRGWVNHRISNVSKEKCL
ncbi:secretion activating protein [Sphingomonadales bacterium 56]|uniref:glycoside hydrolase family 108 protein n=1 Tax=unclassified Sphingobium TaxID=2611147 RepID=UPI00191A1BC0|nr:MULTISPECIES: N-acetylmuramidase [unclassified Sphingobium]MBY2927834.1 secretion activating protein [Sphingomonadales bacterium 56]MBY2957934.1 secretion activating protein [Sphingomonadales bacterium 58]CAD7336030.1 hypothetical protein SPHS6_00806 [Sphingobium sp. S6]CAD7336093.1 hypothetical protein SPHS8_00846 [Sphingobium sp. S8]